MPREKCCMPGQEGIKESLWVADLYPALAVGRSWTILEPGNKLRKRRWNFPADGGPFPPLPKTVRIETNPKSRYKAKYRYFEMHNTLQRGLVLGYVLRLFYRRWVTCELPNKSKTESTHLDAKVGKDKSLAEEWCDVKGVLQGHLRI